MVCTEGGKVPGEKSREKSRNRPGKVRGWGVNSFVPRPFIGLGTRLGDQGS